MPRYPYHRLHPAKSDLPEVGISEEDNIRSLHLGSDTIQSSMNLGHPAELVLSYSRAMMGWLLFAEKTPKHITQIGLGGGSFARQINSYLPDTEQAAVDINPQVITVTRSLFELPFEGENFEIVKADGAEYIKVSRHNTDTVLVDSFDGEQVIDALVEEPSFRDCRHTLSPDGMFVTNWWSGSKRYQHFVERLLSVFEGRVLELPAEGHDNMAVMAFRSGSKEQSLDRLKKRVEELNEQYGLDFKRMLNDLKVNNPNDGKHLYL